MPRPMAEALGWPDRKVGWREMLDLASDPRGWAAYGHPEGSPTSNPAEIGRSPEPKVPLVAIYPKEGALLADHPYAVLAAPWVDDAKRAAAADFLDYVRGGEAQRQFQQFAFRGHDGRAGPTVDRADGLDPKEPASRLALPSAEVLDKVVASWATLRKRANALVVIDVSGSMAAVVSNF